MRPPEMQVVPSDAYNYTAHAPTLGTPATASSDLSSQIKPRYSKLTPLSASLMLVTTASLQVPRALDPVTSPQTPPLCFFLPSVLKAGYV